MKDSNWQKVETIIDQVLDLPPEERETFIDRQCKDDQRLKGEVTRLLESIFDSEGWLENPQNYKEDFLSEIIDDVEALPSDHSLIGKKVGAYSIKEQIGQGGMGSVYLAERSDEGFQHSVAIKIIRHGRATETNIRRFRREQQILADLNHPGIATLFDGGVTDDGFLYIIMEYVDGIPVDEYCRQRNTSIEDKITLFKQILEAVRHAHENLVIHRDLKPGNILVDQSGNVKILDFGISKLLEDDSDLSLTQTGMRMLTPKYAAPEQIKETNITTATDLYALGIIFYELLAGSPPFNFEDTSRHDIERAILEEQPIRPSSKVNSTKLRKKIHGDLDAIAFKAIRKEPDQRYRVANDFLHDLDNYKNGLPVTSREDSFQYRSRKFFNRHQQSAMVVAGILLLIIGLTGFYTWRITKERNLAQLESTKSKNISNFLMGIFQANYPEKSKGKKITARQLLGEGRKDANQIASEKVRADMLALIGKAYSSLGYRDSSLIILKNAKRLYIKNYRKNSLEYASIAHELGLAQGHYKDLALPNFKDSYKIRENILGDKNPKTLKSLFRIAQAYRYLDNLDSAKYYAQKTLSILKNTSNSISGPMLLETKEEIAGILAHSGKNKEAEKIYLDIIAKAKDKEKVDSLQLSAWYQNIAWIYIPQKKFNKAKPYLEQSLQITTAFYGKGHGKTLRVRNDLAGVNRDLENMAEFKRLSKLNIKYTIQRYGTDHKMTCQVKSAYGAQLTQSGLLDEGEQYLKEAIKNCSSALGPNHMWTAVNKSLLAANFSANDKNHTSEELFKQAYKIIQQKAPNFNRINKRQISIIIRIYKDVAPADTGRIDAYTQLLNS